MPVLKNARHERFAQELAKGTKAGEAYGLAGYRESRAAASRLSTKVNIRARVDELLGRGAKRAEVTIESLIQEAAAIQAAASKDKQHAAATAALTAKAKLAGLWVEKTENKNRNVDANSLSDGELAAHIQSDGGGHPTETQGHPSKLN